MHAASCGFVSQSVRSADAPIPLVPPGTRPPAIGASGHRPTPRGEVSMSQATLSLSFTDAQATAIDAALNELEAQFAALVAMPAGERRRLMKMGDKSEAFCRQALSLLG